MAKEKKTNALQDARAALKTAQGEYHKLVKKTTGQVGEDGWAEHQKACRKALADKRYAAGKAAALAAGREAPDREDVIEAAY